MEEKKASRYDINRQKGTALLLGYVFAFALLFVALEWRDTTGSIQSLLPHNDDLFEQDAIPVTNNPVLTPPPPKEAPQVVEKINVVDNTKEVDEGKILTPEEDETKVVDIATTVADVPDETAESQVEGEKVSQEVANIIDVMPEFPGGMAECMKFIQRNLRYPASYRKSGIQGQVVVQFIVNTDGNLTDIKVVKSVESTLDRMALRVVRIMPRWKPGERKGKPVKVKFLMPVSFMIK